MTKPLITLPCTAQELENALHAVCDHDGLWDSHVGWRYDALRRPSSLRPDLLVLYSRRARQMRRAIL